MSVFMCNDNYKHIVFTSSRTLDCKTLENPCHYGLKIDLHVQNLHTSIDRKVSREVSGFIKAR